MLKPEQVLQLQLEVSQTLTQNISRDTIGLALAEVINNVLPFQFFLHTIWRPGATVGYRISSMKNTEGKFVTIQDEELLRLREEDLEGFLRTGEFLRDPNSAGIYSGEKLRKLAEVLPAFGIAYHHHGIRSMMILRMKHTNDFMHVMVISERAENAFAEDDYQCVASLLPQIRLGFENLFRYEKIIKEEQEQKVQLGIMKAFNTREKDLDEMALEAISSVQEYFSSEYWMNVSTIPRGQGKEFRIAIRREGKLEPVDSDKLFSMLELEPIAASEFMRRYSTIFEKPRLYVGEDLEKLQSDSFFSACCNNLGINSVMTIPLTTSGDVNTYIMMGSVRKYAFSMEDVESMMRILPYISMAAQQYYSLIQIQTLKQQLEMEKDYLVEEINFNYNFDEIIGTNHLMKDVFKQIGQVASTDSTVLILGETGTGKELIARAVHNQSPRKSKVLVKVNCASLPSQLVESELFGHEKGSFTGALERRIGKFELANEGTIFLDEIGELPLELQAKLLRVLQEREIERIGGKTTLPLNVRIIAATNRDLETEVAEGRFRSDLYYRLSVFPIHLPPLRERKEDIHILIAHFLQKYCGKMKKPFMNLKAETLQELTEYDWPGNIRELENVIEQTVIIGDGDVNRFKRHSQRQAPAGPLLQTYVGQSNPPNEQDIFTILEQTNGKILGSDGAAALLNLRPSEVEVYERKWILLMLKKSEGRIRGDSGAAAAMGIKPTTLEARMKKLRITKSEIFS